MPGLSLQSCNASRFGGHARASRSHKMLTNASLGGAAAMERAAFKRVVKSNELCLGLFIDSGSTLIAEHLAATPGYDFLLVDAQHSALTYPRLQAMLAAMSVHRRPALVRVGGPNDRIGIQQALDAGAYGVMIPTVKSAADARAAVDAAFFPPLGHRSIAFPIRPQLGRPVAEFIGAANDEVLMVLQVETAQALEELPEILAVPGVDAAFMGPFDLCFSTGLFQRKGYPQGFQSTEFAEMCERVVDCCRAAGVTAGNFSIGAGAPQRMMGQGFTLLAVGTDVGLLDDAVKGQMATLDKLRSES